jgi:hypothetical protein
MLAYELITGQVPLPELPINSVMSFHLLGDIPKPLPLNKDLPWSVAIMSLICLEKKAKDRYPSMSDIGKRLEADLKKLENKKNGGMFRFWFNLFGKKQESSQMSGST